MSKTIEELLAECGDEHVYTREKHDTERDRVVARICEKHGIAPDEIPELIRTHNYAHDAEDIEDDYIALLTWSRITGWPM